MPDDIETLLRDAGHGPTRQIDVEQVHVTGRRRARTRHLATGVGALALLGVVAVGVNGLLPDTPDVPIVDQVPTEPEPELEPAPGDGTDDEGVEDPAPAPSTTEDQDDRTTASGMPELGSTIARVSQDPASGFEVLLTAPDGTTTTFSTEPRARDDLAGSVVLDGQGRAVIASASGDLVRSGPDGSTVLAEGDPEAGIRWNVHGATDAGGVLVSRRDPTGNGVLLLVGEGDLEPWSLPVETSMPEEQFGTATAVGSRLLVTLGVGDSVRWLLYDGDGPPVEVLESSTMPFDDVPSTPVLVGDELWHVETRASDDPEGGGPQDLVLRAGDELLRLPTPFGRDLDAFIGAVSVGQLADGGPALVFSSFARDGSGPGPALLVDLDAARAAAATTAGDDIPEGVFFEFGESAHLLFAP